MFTGKLFPYQDEAVTRICDRESILVAYSMGLGKTPITIAALEDLMGAGWINLALIIVPSSLKWQWAESLTRFTDVPLYGKRLKGATLTIPHPNWATVIDGPKKKREEQWEHVFTEKPEYVICSYQSVLTDWRYISRLPLDAVVCDEATALKNFGSKTAKAIKKLTPRFRIALTGTPVENRPEELFSIMQWVDDEVFGRWDMFDKSFIVRNSFGGVSRYKNLDLMHEHLVGAMVRKSRLDPDVAPYLPDVVERDVPVQLDLMSRGVYRLIERDLLVALDELKSAGSNFNVADFYAGVSKGMSGAHGKVMGRAQALQMFLDHPHLIQMSAQDYLADNTQGSQYALYLFAAGFLDDLKDFIPPKLARTEKLVGEMIEDGGKVIVFTQYRRMLTLLEHALISTRAGSVLYHGGMSSVEKAAAVAKFQEDPHCRIFISSDAGGYGLDLPAANYLVNYDLPYSNGKRQQRNHRHVRASSKHSAVFIANMLCEKTIEVRVRDILELREKLSQAVTDGGTAEIKNTIGSLTEHISDH